MKGKVNFGSKPLVYPMPAAIIGSVVDGRPNFMTIAYCGVVNNNPAMVALGSNPAHHTMGGIREHKTFSVNIPSTAMARKTDYVGIYSGSDVDKSDVFDVYYGTLTTTPLIAEAPVALECRVREMLDLGGNDTIIIGEVVESYIDESCMTDGVPDARKIDPLIYTPNDRKYWSLGTHKGDGWSIGKTRD